MTSIPLRLAAFRSGMAHRDYPAEWSSFAAANARPRALPRISPDRISAG
jgi:hypothetical protein